VVVGSKANRSLPPSRLFASLRCHPSYSSATVALPPPHSYSQLRRFKRSTPPNPGSFLPFTQHKELFCQTPGSPECSPFRRPLFFPKDCASLTGKPPPLLNSCSKATSHLPTPILKTFSREKCGSMGPSSPRRTSSSFSWRVSLPPFPPKCVTSRPAWTQEYSPPPAPRPLPFKTHRRQTLHPIILLRPFP